MLRTKVLIGLLFAWFVCASGCGGDRDGGVPVEGTVTLDGNPLPTVQVTFDLPAASASENKAYIGRTDAEGRFELTPMMGNGSGVPPGEYRVSLTTAVYDPNAPVPVPTGRQSGAFYPESPPPPPERIPPAYRGGKLTFTVPEDGTDQANFELKSK